jgi:hypothetical protein
VRLGRGRGGVGRKRYPKVREYIGNDGRTDGALYTVLLKHAGNHSHAVTVAIQHYRSRVDVLPGEYQASLHNVHIAS